MSRVLADGRTRVTWSAADMSSKWDAVPMAPADPILGVAIAYNNDPHPSKVSCGRRPGWQSPVPGARAAAQRLSLTASL